MCKNISRIALLFLTFGMAAFAASCTSGSSPESASSTSKPEVKKAADETNKSETTQKIENMIKESLPGQNGGDIDIQSVSCPDNIDAKAGNVFRCQAKAPQGPFKVKVTIENVKDGKGSIDMVTEGLLRLLPLEKLLQDNVKQKSGIDVAADCGSKKSKIRLIEKVGETFQCQLSGKGNKTGTATVKVKSETGKIETNWSMTQ